MAIVPQDVSPFIAAMKRDPAAWAALASESPGKDGLRASLQAIEDWFEPERPVIKAAIEAALGRTVSVAYAKKLFRVWMELKFRGE